MCVYARLKRQRSCVRVFFLFLRSPSLAFAPQARPWRSQSVSPRHQPSTFCFHASCSSLFVSHRPPEFCSLGHFFPSLLRPQLLSEPSVDSAAEGSVWAAYKYNQRALVRLSSFALFFSRLRHLRCASSHLEEDGPPLDAPDRSTRTPAYMSSPPSRLLLSCSLFPSTKSSAASSLSAPAFPCSPM